jgi:hypothetical protein
MKPVKKTGVKSAIIIYKDPDSGLDRRIIFGDINETMSLLLDNSPAIFSRLNMLQEIEKSGGFENNEELREIITDDIDVAEVHSAKKYEEGSILNLSYEVKKLN